MLMFNKIAAVSKIDLKKHGLITYMFIKSNCNYFCFFQPQIFLLSAKFINCGKFDYDLNQSKLHEEKGSNFVWVWEFLRVKWIWLKITFFSEIKDRQLLFNQFPPFPIHFGNTRPSADKPVPLFNFQFGNQIPQEHNFDEFIQQTTSQTPIEEQTNKTIIETTTKGKKETQTKKPQSLDQKIESTKTTIPPKVNIKITESNEDLIFFPSDDEDSPDISKVDLDKTTSLPQLLSTTPVMYSTTHKRIIPGLPSPDEDGDYNEDDKISNSALLSLLG